MLSHFPLYSIYQFQKNQVPGILFDVDGVLMLGYTPIKRARETIEKLRQYNIPLMILTNKCGDTENQKASEFSQILRLSKKNAFMPNEIVLCHTPMRSILQHYSSISKDSFPLVLGRDGTHSLMKHYGVKRYITGEEYATIFPYIFPQNWIESMMHKREKNIQQVQRRLRISLNLNSPLRINSIFQMAGLLHQEIAIQLCCDLLISKDGIPGTIRDYTKEKQKIKYYLSNPDFVYMDRFPLPRYAIKSFIVSLQKLFQIQYKHKFEYEQYGKPMKVVFDYARKQCVINANGKIVKNFYMIGDYPDSDIKGANDAGINSILVRTGIFKGEDNDKNYPASYVCNDCFDAIEYILKKEKII